MTINGPAPMILAFFLNAAIDQGVEKHAARDGSRSRACARSSSGVCAVCLVVRGEGLPGSGHDGLGLGLLGVSGDAHRWIADTYAR